MTKVGTIYSLFYSNTHGRSTVETLDLDLKGIPQDKHYNKDIERSVLIASMESYTLAAEHGIDVPKGALGENILMDYNPYKLPSGSKLKMGDTILEISQHCTLCKSFAKVDPKLPKLLKDDRGIFARVVEAGCLKQGDSVYLLD